MIRRARDGRFLSCVRLRLFAAIKRVCFDCFSGISGDMVLAALVFGMGRVNNRVKFVSSGLNSCHVIRFAIVL